MTENENFKNLSKHLSLLFLHDIKIVMKRLYDERQATIVEIMCNYRNCLLRHFFNTITSVSSLFLQNYFRTTPFFQNAKRHTQTDKSIWWTWKTQTGRKHFSIAFQFGVGTTRNAIFISQLQQAHTNRQIHIMTMKGTNRKKTFIYSVPFRFLYYFQFHCIRFFLEVVSIACNSLNQYYRIVVLLF